MCFVIAGYAQKNFLAGTTWDEGFETWTFNSNGTITKKSNRNKSFRLGGVYVTLVIHKTHTGTKWTLDGNYLRCEDIPLQISYTVDYPRYAYSSYQQKNIDAALPSFKQQAIKEAIKEAKESWQSNIGKQYFYFIDSYSPEKMCLLPNGNGRAERCLYRELTAAEKAAIEKEAQREAAEEARREAVRREAEARREAEERIRRETEKRDRHEAAEKAKTAKKEYVNLGLPSGTLWATFNIGATRAEDYGDYFAWGETTGYYDGKDNFEWKAYKWCKGASSTMTKYCTNSSYGYNGFTDNKTELALEDDAAYVNWGPSWRIPSDEQFEELFNSEYTTTTWTTQNGVNGRLITSKSNGNSIFLPAAGLHYESTLYDAGSYGYYRSLSLHESNPNIARYLYFNSSLIRTFDRYFRYSGLSIRPVRLSE